LSSRYPASREGLAGRYALLVYLITAARDGQTRLRRVVGIPVSSDGRYVPEVYGLLRRVSSAPTGSGKNAIDWPDDVRARALEAELKGIRGTMTDGAVPLQSELTQACVLTVMTGRGQITAQSK
jgi:hypothetical protein